MTSQKGSVLSHAVFRLDSRQVAPVQAECKGFAPVLLRPSLRRASERDALQGHLQGSTPFSEATAPVERGDAVEAGQLQKGSLFPLD
jgi:hypothetical protein